MASGCPSGKQLALIHHSDHRNILVGMVEIGFACNAMRQQPTITAFFAVRRFFFCRIST
jgi:hypothetical protein